LKLDYQELNHNYITRLVVFALFLFKEQRKKEKVYHQSITKFIKQRIKHELEISIEVGPKLSLEDQRESQIETLFNSSVESRFLNLVVVRFKTGFKEVTIQINLNDEERYESYLYS